MRCRPRTAPRARPRPRSGPTSRPLRTRKRWRRGVADHQGVQLVETGRTGMSDRLAIAALVQLGLPDRDPGPRIGEPPRPQAEHAADGRRQSVSQWSAADLGARDEQSVRVVSQRRAVPDETGQRSLVEEAVSDEGRRSAPSARAFESRNLSGSGSSTVAGVTRGTRWCGTRSASRVEVAADPCFSSPVVRLIRRLGSWHGSAGAAVLIVMRPSVRPQVRSR